MPEPFGARGECPTGTVQGTRGTFGPGVRDVGHGPAKDGRLVPVGTAYIVAEPQTPPPTIRDAQAIGRTPQGHRPVAGTRRRAKRRRGGNGLGGPWFHRGGKAIEPKRPDNLNRGGGGVWRPRQRPRLNQHRAVNAICDDSAVARVREPRRGVRGCGDVAARLQRDGLVRAVRLEQQEQRPVRFIQDVLAGTARNALGAVQSVHRAG